MRADAPPPSAASDPPVTPTSDDKGQHHPETSLDSTSAPSSLTPDPSVGHSTTGSTSPLVFLTVPPPSKTEERTAVMPHVAENGQSPNALTTIHSGVGARTQISWKSGTGSRTEASLAKKRLATLGFEEELERDFDFWASWGIGVCNIGFLSGTFFGVMTALDYGGGSMYSFAWPISGLFMCSIAAVLGEMASTYPVAGAMFTWTFRLCRSSRALDSWARYLSWIVGSFLLSSHILIQIIITFQFAHAILGVVTLHTTTFSPGLWHSIALSWAVLGVTGIIASSKWSRSPWLWRVCGTLVVAGFLSMDVILLVHAQEIRSVPSLFASANDFPYSNKFRFRPARYVFFSYSNSSGWKSKSYVYIIGWVLTCAATGMEACAHMAEDTKKPARTVPLAMFWSTATSYILGWVSITIVLATAETQNMPPRLLQPIGILANTLPLSWATVISAIVLFTLAAQNVAQLMATSRFIWALARESALPFSMGLRRISASQKQPLIVIWTVVVISGCSLFLLGISQTVVSTILLQGAGWTTMFAYVVPMILFLFCPKDALSGDGRNQWTLRAFTKPLAVVGCFFGLIFMIVMFLPTGYPVDSLNASYASAIAVALLLLSTLTWIVYGNARYAGPIKTSTRWTLGAEVELPATTTFKTATAPQGASTSGGHGRSAHVFSSFPTLRSNDDAPPSTVGDVTTGEYSYEEGEEDSRWEGTSSVEASSYWESRGRVASLAAMERGVRGRERSRNGSIRTLEGGGPPAAQTP